MKHIDLDPNLPEVVTDAKAANDFIRSYNRDLKDIGRHWAALMEIEDLKPIFDEDVPDAESADKALKICQKAIKDVGKMALPAAEKTKYVEHWKRIEKEVREHVTQIDLLRLSSAGFVAKSPKDIRLTPAGERYLWNAKARVKVSQEAHDLYAKFYEVVKAANAFYLKQAELGLREWDITELLMRVRSVNDFAMDFEVHGTWKTYTNPYYK